MELEEKIFNSHTEEDFLATSLEVFRFQFEENPVYRKFCNLLKVQPSQVETLKEIPFLPISFFKTHQVSTSKDFETLFTSSGTTGKNTSKHYVKNLSLYEKSFHFNFKAFYDAIEDYTVLALLPSYLEREGSSLIYMANDFIEKSRFKESGFYLNNLNELAEILTKLDKQGRKILLLGVSFALLDLVENHQFELKNTVVMETGGMKGRRKEMIRKELHQKLSDGFRVQKIHSEYGMTELLSQAYSTGNGIFNCPNTMKILVRETDDALSYVKNGKTGGLNVIDLANLYSCSFIATQDLGKSLGNNRYEILGRFDNSDIRGCNLLHIG